MRPSDLSGEARDAYRMWHDFFGLSEESAMRAVAQDGLVESSEFDRTASAFRRIFGLSEGAAETAARGRDGSFSGLVSESLSGDVSEARFRWAQEALSRMTDLECDAMLLEEQRRRRNPVKKSASGRSGEPGKKHRAVVSEWDRRK